MRLLNGISLTPSDGLRLRDLKKSEVFFSRNPTMTALGFKMKENTEEENHF
jgi:hypothetical protein